MSDKGFTKRDFLKTLAGATMAATLPAGAFSQGANALERVKSAKTLRIGWATWPPYALRDPAKRSLEGASIEIGNLIGQKMGVKVEWVEDSWATLIAGIQAAKFDMTIPMGATPERMKSVDFSERFLQYLEGIMIRKSDVGKYKSLKDLDQKGKVITTTLGSTSDDLKAVIKNAEIIFAKDGPTSLNQLLTNRADGFANVHDLFRSLLKERNDVAMLPGEPYGRQALGCVVKQGEKELLAEVNKAIVAAKGSGEILAILKKREMAENYFG
jgi:ABC-type amino acid transport substrate-binding protein